MEANTIWTVGHSTRTIAEFIELLRHYGLTAVVDVRRYPGSRRNPQFGREQLKTSLAKAGIDYYIIEELGGRRRPAQDSENTSWRNLQFRGYADHMAGSEFHEGLQQLCDIASRSRTAIMCAELLWWRCHRSMIADALMVRGIKVIHIQDENHSQEHPYTQPARLYRGELSYVYNKGPALSNRASASARR